MSKVQNKKVLSKQKSKKVTQPSQKHQNSYYCYLVAETHKLKEQKLKELLELEEILTQLNGLVKNNLI